MNRKISLNEVNISSEVRILDTSWLSPIYRGLKRKDVIFMSEFLENKKGKVFKNFYSENLESLTFDDNTFDFVISSEVFEHVIDPWKGFLEVHRVLKKNGYHIFTVPYNENMMTVKRVERWDGNLNYLFPEYYHRDPLSRRGALVCTDFGKDIFEKLATIGFQTEFFKTEKDDSIFGGASVFVSQKL